MAWDGDPPGNGWPGLLDARSGGLLSRSLAIAAGATVLALCAGILLAVPLARIRLAARGVAVGSLLVALGVSPYLLALGWLALERWASGGEFVVGQPMAVVAVLGAAHAPLVAVALVLAARAAPRAPEEAGLLAMTVSRVAALVLLPRVFPALAAATLLVFVLCLSDHAVASLLQVLTYPVEIFLLYAGSFDASEAARACIPLVAVGAATAAAFAATLPGDPPQGSSASGRLDWSLGRRERLLGGTILVGALTVTVGLPFAGLFLGIERVPEALGAIRSSGGAIGHSLGIALAGASLCPLLGLAASELIVRAPARARRALAAVLLLPLCVPSSAYAIAWVELGREWGPFTVLPAFLEPALCLVGRWAGPAALLLAAARLSLPRGLREAALLQEESDIWRFLRVELPLIAPLALVASAAVAADSLAASGLLVLTVPPGIELLPLRVDNLIHYGERGAAAALALTQAILSAGLFLGLLGLARRLDRSWR